MKNKKKNKNIQPLTKKVQVYPDASAQQKLWHVSGLCNNLHNALIEQRKDRNSWGHVNVFTQKKELPEIKKEFPEFKIPSSQVLQNVVITLDQSYKSTFTKKRSGDKEAGFPGYRSAKIFFTQEYSQRDITFFIEDNVLRLAYGSSPKDHILILLPENNYDNVVTVKACFKRKKWYVCFSIDIPIPDLVKVGSKIYFDPGSVMTLAGLKTTGEFFNYDMKPLRDFNMNTYHKIDELYAEQKKLVKSSRKYRRVAAQIRDLFYKIHIRSHWYLNQLADQILNDHPDVMEFLIGNWTKQETISDSGNVFKDKRINRAVQNNLPLQKLIDILVYKARLRGQKVDKFDERGTSSTCVYCLTKTSHDPSKRTFVCSNVECGFSFPRDLHSCLNFIRLKEPKLWKEYKVRLPEKIKNTGLSPFRLKRKIGYGLVSKLKGFPEAWLTKHPEISSFVYENLSVPSQRPARPPWTRLYCGTGKPVKQKPQAQGKALALPVMAASSSAGCPSL